MQLTEPPAVLGKTEDRTDGPRRIYTPDGRLGFGWRVWRDMAHELIQARELMWRLFRRDLSARYRQSVLGYVWAVMPAIVTTITFAYLKGSGTLPIGETDLPYPAFVLVGLSVWQLFATGLTQCANSLIGAQSIIIHINFSREALVIAAFGQSVFEFLIRAFLIAAVFLWYGIIPAWTILLVPLILLPLALLTVGLGFFLSLANGIFRDIGNSLPVILTFAMFLAPVVYPPPTHGTKALLNYLNPVSPFIIATRDLISKGGLTQPSGLLVATIVSAIILLAAWRVFHLAISRVAERV
jgi:lipopolysaccharide transport system permease protein